MMWLSINDNYECSVDGVIRNKKTLRCLKTWKATGNYIYSRVGGAGSKKKAVHRIVGELFLPSPTENDCEIDHIDRNNNNNNANNLRWVSKSVNALNKNLETKPRKNNCLNQQYITLYSNLYLVKIKNRIINIYKSFKTLEEAIFFRNSIIEKNGV